MKSMKTLLLGITLITGSGTIQELKGAEPRQSIPTNITPDQVVEMSSSARLRLLANYAANSNRWATSNLLPIAIAYWIEGQTAKSESAYVAYLKVRPDDARANRGFGMLCLSQKKFSEAIELLSKAWSLRDEDALPPLVAAYLATKQRDKARDLLPDMMSLKNKTKPGLRDNLVDALLGYAVTSEPFDSKLFAQVIEGISDNEILANDGAPELVIEGLKLSGEHERAAALAERLERRKRPNTKDKIL